MTKYRPLKEGSQVVRISDGKRGVIRSILPSGQAKVRFRADLKEQFVLLALLKRLPRPPTSGRKKKVALPTPQISFASLFREVVISRSEQLSLTQDGLCKKAGLSRTALRRVLSSEYKSFRVSTLEAIAVALGISPREFWTPAEEVSSVQDAPPTDSIS